MNNMKYLKLNEDTLLDYEAWGKRIYVHIDNDKDGGYVEMKIGNAEDTRDDLTSMKSVSKEYIMKPKPEVIEDEIIEDENPEKDDVDETTGEIDIDDLFDDWNEEEEYIDGGSDEPIGSTDWRKFKIGDKINHKPTNKNNNLSKEEFLYYTHGDGIIIHISEDGKKGTIKFDKGIKKILMNVPVLTKIG